MGFLYCFLEAVGRWEEWADTFFKLLPRLGEGVEGGGGNSNTLQFVGGCEPDLSSECLQSHCIEVVAESEV